MFSLQVLRIQVKSDTLKLLMNLKVVVQEKEREESKIPPVAKKRENQWTKTWRSDFFGRLPTSIVIVMVD